MLQLILLVVVLMSIYYVFDQARLRKKFAKKESPKETRNPLLEAIVDISKNGRGKIHASNDGLFILSYNDEGEVDNHLTFLRDYGYKGDGDSWQGIIHGALLLSDPDILKQIEMSQQEASVQIKSKKKEVLQSITRLIATLKEDETLLVEAVQMAELNDKMV